MKNNTQMTRQTALTILFAEAFSETGLAARIANGEDPGRERLNHLIEALHFLTDELADEDAFGRELVSALFTLGQRVPGLMREYPPEGANFRPSLYEQADELSMAVTALIENWNHWPDIETYAPRAYRFETPVEESVDGSDAEQIGGYRVGDVTYCVIPGLNDCFPVQVNGLGNGYLDVTPLVEASSVYADLMQEAANRRFFYPLLSPGARLGSDDERLANSQRKSGPELRLLPVDYATTTLDLIRARHAADPLHWPLPGGLVFEKWFREPGSETPAPKSPSQMAQGQ